MKVDCDKEIETESDYEAQSEVLQSELYHHNKENDEIWGEISSVTSKVQIGRVVNYSVSEEGSKNGKVAEK